MRVNSFTSCRPMPRFTSPFGPSSLAAPAVNWPRRRRLTTERGLPTAGTIAQVVIAKYLNHMPLHRQAAHYARLGVLLATTTLYGWVEAAARDLAPVACSSCCSGGPRSMPTIHP